MKQSIRPRIHDAIRVHPLALIVCLSTGSAAFAAEAELIALGAQLGISPESLTASGLDGPGTVVVLTQLHETTDLRNAIEARQVAIADATLSASLVMAGVSCGAEASGASDAFQLTLTHIASQRQELADLKDALLVAALAGIAPEAAQQISSWRQSDGVRVPPEFRVVQLAGPQWREVEAAVLGEQRAARTGEPLSSEYAALLAQIRSMPAVVSAKHRLDAGLSAVTAAFDSAGLQLEP